MEDNVKNSFRVLGELTNLLAEKKSSWHQQLLIASTTLFGVLIALQQGNASLLAARLTFALAVAFLAIGILLIAISLYSHVDAISRARKLATDESIKALREERAMNPIAAKEKKKFQICEKLAYICYALSMILLTIYVVLKAIFV